MLSDEDGEKVFDAVLRRHAVQELERFGPVAGQEGVEGGFIELNVFVRQLGIIPR